MQPPTSRREEPASEEQSYLAPTSPWTNQTAENALNDAYNG